MKIDAGAWKIISCSKIQACTSENIAPKSKTYHVFLNRPLFLSNLTQWLLAYLIVFATISLPFYLLLLALNRSWSLSSASTSFFIRTNEILMRLNVLSLRFSSSIPYYVLILWIIIQTHIRKMDSYSDTDSEKLDISLSK